MPKARIYQPVREVLTDSQQQGLSKATGDAVVLVKISPQEKDLVPLQMAPEPDLLLDSIEQKKWMTNVLLGFETCFSVVLGKGTSLGGPVGGEMEARSVSLLQPQRIASLLKSGASNAATEKDGGIFLLAEAPTTGYPVNEVDRGGGLICTNVEDGTFILLGLTSSAYYDRSSRRDGPTMTMHAPIWLARKWIDSQLQQTVPPASKHPPAVPQNK